MGKCLQRVITCVGTTVDRWISELCNINEIINVRIQRNLSKLVMRKGNVANQACYLITRL